ncbi:DNA adenine methylase [Anaerolineae bacterium CFX7]|nr:DNA adenine methylase [Anaerolineae bacterium CFX7]
MDTLFTRHPLPFRYPGGKYYAINILRPFWQAVVHDEYREPFAGGATIFFQKAKARFNWLNDLDSELVTTYRVMSDRAMRRQLVAMLSKETASKERWRELQQFTPSTDLEVAFRYYYLNRTSFSGKMVSSAWGYRQKRSLPPERWHERVLPCGEKLENVKLTACDFAQVIAAPARGAKTLLFVDPPYFSPPKKKHYRNGFTFDDHARLCQALKQTHHSFFLTYDDVPEIRAMYQWANLTEAKFFYRVDNSNVQNGARRTGFELVITNYAMPEQIVLY